MASLSQPLFSEMVSYLIFTFQEIPSPFHVSEAFFVLAKKQYQPQSLLILAAIAAQSVLFEVAVIAVKANPQDSPLPVQSHPSQLPSVSIFQQSYTASLS